jgi:hypothetical protein
MSRLDAPIKPKLHPMPNNHRDGKKTAGLLPAMADITVLAINTNSQQAKYSIALRVAEFAHKWTEGIHASDMQRNNVRTDSLVPMFPQMHWGHRHDRNHGDV